MNSAQTLLRVATCLGHPVHPSSRILDFGCGDGERVKELRDAGYDAYGVDIQFKSGTQTGALEREGAIQRITLAPYTLPFPNESFDFVFSEQVFEHVQNYGETLSELNRVMKPGAVGLHRFPSRLRPLESHVRVPFASVFRPSWWMVLWSHLGFVRPSQRGRSGREAARTNRAYLDEKTNYLSGREIFRHFSQYNRVAEPVGACWFTHSPNPRGRALGRIVQIIPAIPWVYQTFWTRMIHHVK